MNGVMSASVSPGSSQREASVTCSPITIVPSGGAARAGATVARMSNSARPRDRSRIASSSWSLLASAVEPYFLHARVVVERVVRGQVLHVRPADEVLVAPTQHGSRHVRFEPALDLPHELES